MLLIECPGQCACASQHLWAELALARKCQLSSPHHELKATHPFLSEWGEDEGDECLGIVSLFDQTSLNLIDCDGAAGDTQRESYIGSIGDFHFCSDLLGLTKERRRPGWFFLFWNTATVGGRAKRMVYRNLKSSLYHI